MNSSKGVSLSLEDRVLALQEANIQGRDGSLTHPLLPTFCRDPSIDWSTETLSAPMTIWLIDSYRFSRECISDALLRLQPNSVVHSFDSVESCIADGRPRCELIVFHLHIGAASDTAGIQHVSGATAAFPDMPLVVLSDAEDAYHLKTIRSILKCGARGVISTRTIGLSVAVAAIRLVKAGGTFAPMDALLSGRTERAVPMPDTLQQARLTSRQMVVLSHIERGHANKTIAYELSMSESTVKVHVRNIMRKVGATNRTQAVYKVQKIREDGGLACTPVV